MALKTQQVRDRRSTGSRFFREPWILTAALFAYLPMALTTLGLVWFGNYSLKLQCTVTVGVLLCGLWFPMFLKERIAFALRTLSGQLSSLREQDYSARLDEAGRESGALGEAFHEVNALRDTLKRERTGAVEAGALLEKVMANIDVAVFAFDSGRRLRLANNRGQRLLGVPEDRLMGRPAVSFGLDVCLDGPAPRIARLSFNGRPGRWEIRRAPFREEGQPLELLVLSDLTAPLRKEELDAWRRLVQVLRHEISNSLAPIQSFSQSLLWLISQNPKPQDWEADCVEGLEVIVERSMALGKMLASYKGLAGLPAPRLEPMPVSAWVHRIAALETRLQVKVEPGPQVSVQADPGQLDQLLLNLVKNAADASLMTGGGVVASWAVDEGHLAVWVDDEGEGLANTDNLFVPFFTTKKDGSGIGLALGRQIAEAHGGELSLENHSSGRGCRARMDLPLEVET